MPNGTVCPMKRRTHKLRALAPLHGNVGYLREG